MDQGAKQETFVSEAIEPIAGTFASGGMSRGEPGLPDRFVWRGEEHRVGDVLEVWKTSGESGCGEIYLRRHWYKVRTEGGLVMTLYFERQARTAKSAKRRWFVYSVEG